MADDKPIRNLEELECPILNSDWIQKNQQVIKAIGGNPADVKSPGLKVQMVFDENHNLIKSFCPQYDICVSLTQGCCLYEDK